MFKRRKKTFKWQINASAVGKLLGYFGTERREQAIAECWQMNVKRMSRFGVTPAEPLTQKLVSEVVQEQLEQKPVYKQMVSRAIESNREQRQIVQEIKAVADKEVVQAKRKYEETKAKAKAVAELKELPKYVTRKSGTKRAAIGSFFISNGKVYQKVTRRGTTISTMAIAKEHGYRQMDEIKEASKNIQKDLASKKSKVETAETVNKEVIKQATKAINTTRGIIKESTDLQLVQKRFPLCRAGNDKAYFMHVSGKKWPAFIIGRIDGIIERTMIFELKHRQARLFNELRRYEQVQCMLYMKMVKINHCILVETYEGEQVYYEMYIPPETGRLKYRKEGSESFQESLYWSDIIDGLKEVVDKLNKAEEDPLAREILKSKLY